MASIQDVYGHLKTLTKKWFYDKTEVDNKLSNKQNTLISGTNLKTINNTSLLGSGNITITGGSGNNGSECLVDYYFDEDTNEIVLEYCGGKLISSIDKSTSGLVDTYTINYTDNTTYQFTVTNATGGGSNITVDSTWVANSTNPVESQLIKTALDGKASSSHTHTISNITDFPTLFSGSYADLTNKPSYTPTITSSTNGAYKIGSININGSNVDIYGKDTDTHQSLVGYLQTSDVVDNLSSTSSTAPLSAKQGKALNDLIGSAISYINQ